MRARARLTLVSIENRGRERERERVRFNSTKDEKQKKKTKQSQMNWEKTGRRNNREENRRTHNKKIYKTRKEKKSLFVKTCTKFRPLNFLCTRFVIVMRIFIARFSLSFCLSLLFFTYMLALGAWTVGKKNCGCNFLRLCIPCLCSHSLKIYLDFFLSSQKQKLWT